MKNGIQRIQKNWRQNERVEHFTETVAQLAERLTVDENVMSSNLIGFPYGDTWLPERLT